MPAPSALFCLEYFMTLSKRAFILFEVFGFIAFALMSKLLVSLWTWKYAGPITLITTLVLLTIYMGHQNRDWSMYGLKPLVGLKIKLLLLPQCFFVFLAFAAAVGSVLGVAEIFQIEFLQQVPEGIEERFGEVRNNLPRYLMWLAIVWTSAAFGEEMFFRGYLVTRLQEAFSGVYIAPALAILIAATVFAYGHAGYQGLRGFIITGLIGIAFGIMYLTLKKNLWPIILVHGIIDTISFTSMYVGVE